MFEFFEGTRNALIPVQPGPTLDAQFGVGAHRKPTLPQAQGSVAAVAERDRAAEMKRAQEEEQRKRREEQLALQLQHEREQQAADERAKAEVMRLQEAARADEIRKQQEQAKIEERRKAEHTRQETLRRQQDEERRAAVDKQRSEQDKVHKANLAIQKAAAGTTLDDDEMEYSLSLSGLEKFAQLSGMSTTDVQMAPVQPAALPPKPQRLMQEGEAPPRPDKHATITAKSPSIDPLFAGAALAADPNAPAIPRTAKPALAPRTNADLTSTWRLSCCYVRMTHASSRCARRHCGPHVSHTDDVTTVGLSRPSSQAQHRVLLSPHDC